MPCFASWSSSPPGSGGRTTLTVIRAGFHARLPETHVPFVVAIDSLGRTVSAGPAEVTTTADEKLKKAVLFTWIEDLRLVTTDPFAQRKAIDRVYAHLAMGSEAQAFVTAFYRADPPQKRGQTQTVSIDVKSVLPNSNRTYEIEWIETTHDLNGGIVSTDHWKGSFTIALNPPTEERLMRVNPLGIYVTDAAWTKVL